MDRFPRIRGFVHLEGLDPVSGVRTWCETPKEFRLDNLVVNVFREMLPLLLAPRIVTGRVDNTQSSSTWLDRRICLLGLGVGDGSLTPSTKPEEPEDGRTKLVVGDPDYPTAKQGLQGPMRRVPLTPSGPSEINQPGLGEIPSYYLLKEVDSDGVVIEQVQNGGAVITYTFTIGTDEYIGNIMEAGLFFGGGDAGDDTQFLVAPGEYDRERLKTAAARMAARKTRDTPYPHTRGSAFRVVWRIFT